MLNGLLLIDKPAGWTSHDVVAKVRSLLRTEIRNQQLENSKGQPKGKLIPNSQLPISPSAKPKVGHTGTLDPLATGLMILVLGSYTKRAQEFSKLDKTYEAELTLGATSATGDSEGPIIPTENNDSYQNTRSSILVRDIAEVLQSFVGRIMQKPHPHSAVKIGGQRAYKLARQGKEVIIEPRKVTIYELQTTNYEYPKLCLTARVSSGTYIRSLAEDIGQKLGTGAYLSALRRTKVGNFDIEKALEVEDLTVVNIENNLQK